MCTADSSKQRHIVTELLLAKHVFRFTSLFTQNKHVTTHVGRLVVRQTVKLLCEIASLLILFMK